MAATGMQKQFNTEMGEANAAARIPEEVVKFILMKHIRPKNSENTYRGRALTDRQREIATLITIGMTNKEIARELEISPSTVKNHITVILNKVDVDRRSKIYFALNDILQDG